MEICSWVTQYYAFNYCRQLPTSLNVMFPKKNSKLQRPLKPKKVTPTIFDQDSSSYSQKKQIQLTYFKNCVISDTDKQKNICFETFFTVYIARKYNCFAVVNEELEDFFFSKIKSSFIYLINFICFSVKDGVIDKRKMKNYICFNFNRSCIQQCC